MYMYLYIYMYIYMHCKNYHVYITQNFAWNFGQKILHFCVWLLRIFLVVDTTWKFLCPQHFHIVSLTLTFM